MRWLLVTSPSFLPLVAALACAEGEATRPEGTGVGVTTPTSSQPTSTTSDATSGPAMDPTSPATGTSTSAQPTETGPEASTTSGASTPGPTGPMGPTGTAGPTGPDDPAGPSGPGVTPSAGGAPVAPAGSAGAPAVPTDEPAPSTGVFPEGVTTPKIMIVGDSTWAGPGCYKKYLLQNLQDNGYTRFEFVGEYTDDCGSEVRHSAVSCSTAQQYTRATFTISNCDPVQDYPGMSTLMASHDPDLVLLQLGVNDVWGGSTAASSVLANYETLVEQARAHNPNVVLVVAQIQKIITQNCPADCTEESPVNPAAQSLVEAVPAWASGISTPESPVFVADLWTNSSPCEANDCVHPDDAGAQRMGDNWYNAIKDILPRD